MFYIADLHVHSHYSRATSKDLNLESLYQWAQAKGIHVVGTGDFTHPLWFKELQEKLEPDGAGLFRLKRPPAEPALPGMKVQDIDVRFCLTTEISSIYKYGDRVRKNHNLVYAPDFETVARINARLSAIGNLASDGRPILGLPSRNLLEIVLEASERAYLIPAHIWTPWFSTLGSRGGYDSIDECFRDLSGHIFAIETGLSSDPAMNWQWSALDRFTMISNSDAHSAPKLGREATLFDTERSYDGLFNALKTRQGFAGTYEFFPEEGKYHHDGHRKCGVSLLPETTVSHNGLCPQCGEPLTVGVLHRIQKLSDRKIPQPPPDAPAFDHLIPLPEILGEIRGSGPESKGVQQAFHQAISTFGNEFNILKAVPVEDIRRYGNPLLAEAIRRMREQEVKPVPGYDGLYGVIKIFGEGELGRLSGKLYLLGGEEGPAATRKAAIPGASAVVQSFRQNGSAEKEAVSLNQAQEAVKNTLEGAVLVKAGPGTGKTSTLIQWINQQLTVGQAPPAAVLAITFTHKAATEIRDRLTALAGEAVRPMWIGTFHAIAYRMLQERDPRLDTVYDEESRLSVIRFLFPELKETESRKLCGALARLFELRDGSGFPDIHRYATRYCAYVQEQHAVDLSQILAGVVDGWKKEPAWLEVYRQRVQVIAVDEFQDINALQYEFLQLLGAGKRILAIGDPDQAIYGFRGAEVKLFFDFAEEFNAKQIALTENYRSSRTILEAAGEVIRHNTLRSGIGLQANRAQGPRIKCYQAEDATQEAKFIIKEIEKQVGGFHHLTMGTGGQGGSHAFSDIAVLFRTHAVGRELLAMLKQSDIPVHISDGAALLAAAPFSIIADIFRIYTHPRDMVALHGILHYALGWERQETRAFLSRLHEQQLDWRDAVPTVSKKAAESFRGWKTLYEQLPALFEQQGIAGAVKAICGRYLPDQQLTEEQVLKKETILTLAKEAGVDVHQFLEDTTLSVHTDAGVQHAYGIHLLTFHASKGLEFPVVFIAGAENGITPSGRSDTDMEEERRLFYVGITRAKETLYITSAAKRMLYGKEQQQEISPFVNDIPAALCEQVKAGAKQKKKNKEGENQLPLF